MRFARVVSLVVAVILTCSLAPRANACINAVRLTKFDTLRRIAAVEWLVERDQFWLADMMIPVGQYGDAIGYVDVIDEPRREAAHLEDGFDVHLVDAQTLIDLRWRGDARSIDYAKHWFEKRFERHKSPRFAAWLAEAYARDEQIPRALGILRDLERRDLMPDAHAYATLARMTEGAERRSALARCYARAAAKTVCPPTTI